MQSPLAGQWVLIFVLLLLFLHIQSNYYYLDQSNNYYIKDYGLSMLLPLPPNSLLLVEGDLMFNSITYLQWAENVRQDVKVMSLELMTYEWYVKHQANMYPSQVIFPGLKYHPHKYGGFSMAGFLDSNYHRFSIFNAGGWKHGDHSTDNRYMLVPVGFFFAVHPINQITSSVIETIVADKSANIAVPIDDEKYNDVSWEKVVKKDYIQAHHLKGYFLLEHVLGKNRFPPALEKNYAQTCADSYLRLLPYIDSQQSSEFDYMYLNIGLCLDFLRQFYPPNEKGLELSKDMMHYWKIYLTVSSDKSSPAYTQIHNAVSAWDDYYHRL